MLSEEGVSPLDDTIDIGASSLMGHREYSPFLEVPLLLAVRGRFDGGSAHDFVVGAGTKAIPQIGHTLGTIENDKPLEVWRSTITHLPSHDTVRDEPRVKELSNSLLIVIGVIVHREAPKLRLRHVENENVCVVS